MQNSLIQSFVDLGLISSDQKMVIITEQKRFPRLLSQILLDLNFLSSRLIFETISRALDTSYIDLNSIQSCNFNFSVLDSNFCLDNKVIAFGEDGIKKEIFLAMEDPDDVIVFDTVRRLLRDKKNYEPKITRFLADFRQIEKIINDLSFVKKSNFNVGSTSIIELVEQILREAVIQEASDIHIIPQIQSIVIKLRIDGELQFYRVLHNTYQSKITTRIKVMSNLDIAESRRPQSGRFEQKISGFDVDFRVSSHATIHGEQIVIRLLNKSRKLLKLGELGFNTMHQKTLLNSIDKPYGLILVSGPTGSGKTTTLYSLLQEINSEERSIISLEEPVEYRIHGIRQTEIIPHGPITFASGIRSILRQDPDVIMIGEIRDEETAKMALRASMTGHLVLSTVHAQDAFGIVNRLIDLGISPSELSGQLLALVGQRLIKMTCSQCMGDGCLTCTHKGYRGRTVIAEVIEYNDLFDHAVRNDWSRGNLTKIAKGNNIKTIWDHAEEKIKGDITTCNEVKRVLGVQF